MRLHTVPVSLLALVALATPAAARAQTEPREVVDRIAAAIADNYFDPARGEAIARELRTEAASGAFDDFADPRDLAQTLTTRLKPLDRHFSVSWSPPGGETAGPGPTRRGPEDVAERLNHGFRRVERLSGGVGYVDMSMFAGFGPEGAASAARRRADAVLELVSGAGAVIFDLRDNGGGSPEMVGYLVSAFVEPGRDVYNVFHEREGRASEAPAAPYPSPRPGVPLFILTSGRTGSAAEAFAYTLQAAGRAVIVGETSGGAANPGGPVNAGGGFRVFVSRGSPVNPLTGGNWEGVGVKPDVEVAADEALPTAWILALEAMDPAAGRERELALAALRADGGREVRAEDYVGAYGASTVQLEAGRLTWRIGRRPPWILSAVGPDEFSVEGEPSRRVRFERDAEGRVRALETEVPQFGQTGRHLRTG